MSFSDDLDKFTRNHKERMDDIVGAVVFEVGKQLVFSTPVGDTDYWQPQSLPAPKGYVGGRARGNWQHGVGKAPKGETGNVDSNGAMTIMEISMSIPQQASGKIHYLSNNVPYILRLEEGTLSRQAPNGMAGITVKRFSVFMRQSVGKFQ